MTDLEKFLENIPKDQKQFFDLSNYDLNFLEKKAWGFKYNTYSGPFISCDICWGIGGGFSSWHWHQHQYNAFLVLFGKLKVIRETTVENEHNPTTEINLEPGMKTMVFPRYKHKFYIMEPCVFSEISSVRFNKDDINRDDQGGPGF